MSIFGKSSLGKGQQQLQPRKYFKLKNGEQAYRIIPPIGPNKDIVYHSVHYGYKSTDGKQKPFASPEVKNRNMVIVPDAAKERLESLKAKLEEAKLSGNKAAVEKLTALVGSYPAMGLYSLSNMYYMNVIDAQGNIGILSIKYKAKLALEAEIKKLGFDPTDPANGRYFVFNRTGMGRDTTVSVSVLKEKISVEKLGTVERDVVHVIDEETMNRCAVETQNSDGTTSYTYKEAANLTNLFKRPTAEEVRKIVEESDLMTGVSPYLDELFGKSKGALSPTIEEVAEEAEVKVVAPKTSIITPKASSLASPKSTATVLNELDDDEFMKMLKNGEL